MSGSLDESAADQLREATVRASRFAAPVLIEMSDVTDLATPVVGVLVGAWRLLPGRLTLRCSPPVYAALESRGLDRLLPFA